MVGIVKRCDAYSDSVSVRRVTCGMVPGGVERAGVVPRRRVVEHVRLGGLAARPHEHLHAHRLRDVRATVRRHAAYEVRL